MEKFKYSHKDQIQRLAEILVRNIANYRENQFSPRGFIRFLDGSDFMNMAEEILNNENIIVPPCKPIKKTIIQQERVDNKYMFAKKTYLEWSETFYFENLAELHIATTAMFNDEKEEIDKDIHFYSGICKGISYPQNEVHLKLLNSNSDKAKSPKIFKGSFIADGIKEKEMSFICCPACASEIKPSQFKIQTCPYCEQKLDWSYIETVI